jgi:hypothetical protein
MFATLFGSDTKINFRLRRMLIYKEAARDQAQ